MNDEPCENKYCLMDRELARGRIAGLTFENKQLRRIVEILIEPYAHNEEMSIEEAFRKHKERPDE